MKKLSLALVVLLGLNLVTGCGNSMARSFGGEQTVTLEPNLKLEEITWKENSLWYLTRPMREGEEAETHVFRQKTDMGVFEGTVTVIESKN